MNILKKIVVAIAILVLSVTVAACQAPNSTEVGETQPAENEEVPAEVIEQEPDPGVSEQELETVPANAARASELLGEGVDLSNIAVVEAETSDVDVEAATGEISDMVIGNDGTIQHVIFDVNEGFVDLNDTTLALPWSLFEVNGVRGNEATFPDYQIVFTGDSSDLNNAPVVDENFFDGDFWIDPVDHDFMNDSAGNAFLATRISDMELINPADEDLGEVEDLLIDVREGMVSYTVTDFGGFLGMNETATAVPFEELSINSDEEVYVLDVTEEQLEAAPQIDVSLFEENIFDENWDANFADFWNNLETAEAEIDQEIDEEMSEETASGEEVPAEVIEQEPDPGVSEQELETVPANAARASELLGEGVDLSNIVVVEAETSDVDVEAATGEISDMVIGNDGTIQHVIFDVNEGFVDLNDTTLALPWSLFEVNGVSGNEATFPDYQIVFTGDSSDLNNAPVVDENFFDGDFWIDPVAYGFMNESAGNSFLATRISDMELVNPADEDLGEVEDLLIDVREGVVSYAVTDFGGFLGMNETATAVPFEELSINSDEEVYVLDVTEEQLEAAPQIDVSLFDENIFDENWDADFAEFWDNF